MWSQYIINLLIHVNISNEIIKRYVFNNNTAVHILGHEDKGFISSEMNERLKNGKNDRKRVKMHKNIQKRQFF